MRFNVLQPSIRQSRIVRLERRKKKKERNSWQKMKHVNIKRKRVFLSVSYRHEDTVTVGKYFQKATVLFRDLIRAETSFQSLLQQLPGSQVMSDKPSAQSFERCNTYRLLTFDFHRYHICVCPRTARRKHSYSLNTCEKEQLENVHMESLKARTRIWIRTGRKTVYGRGRALIFLIVPRVHWET